MLTNLLSNAVKFGKPRSSIEVSVFEVPGFRVISIFNEGVGLTDVEKEQIIKPFSQLDGFGARERPKGTGLGLPITKALIEDHGGTMEIESELGVGTTFSLRFPLKTSTVKSCVRTQRSA